MVYEDVVFQLIHPKLEGKNERMMELDGINTKQWNPLHTTSFHLGMSTRWRISWEYFTK
jgi:hypothetical protein